MRKLLERARASSEGTKRKIIWIGTIVMMIFILIAWGVYAELTKEPPKQSAGPIIPEEVSSSVNHLSEIIAGFRSKTSEALNALPALLNSMQQHATSAPVTTQEETTTTSSFATSTEEGTTSPTQTPPESAMHGEETAQ